ncbi:MAG: hypothetical protein Q9197_005902 [Variospora fuerteventurae]
MATPRMGGIVGTGYALGCNKFDDWSDLEKKSEQKSKKDFETKFKDFDPRMVRGQIRDLQKQARKMDPEYRPDERGYGRNTKSITEPTIQPKEHTTDLVRRFAGMCKVPETKERRKAWEWLLPYQQEDVREMVRDRMGVYGITCPKTANPFGDDADDKEDYLEDYGDD